MQPLNQQYTPQHEIAVSVVDNGGDTTIRVIFNELGGLLLVLGEVEIDRLIRQAQLLQNKSNLPVTEGELL